MRLTYLFASVLLFAVETGLRASQEDVPPQELEYASVNVLAPLQEHDRVTARVLVCQMTHSGCRDRQFEAVLMLTESNHSAERAAQIAISRALSTLGSEGWELVGRGPEGLGFSLYLKRGKVRSGGHGHGAGA